MKFTPILTTYFLLSLSVRKFSCQSKNFQFDEREMNRRISKDGFPTEEGKTMIRLNEEKKYTVGPPLKLRMDEIKSRTILQGRDLPKLSRSLIDLKDQKKNPKWSQPDSIFNVVNDAPKASSVLGIIPNLTYAPVPLDQRYQRPFFWDSQERSLNYLKKDKAYKNVGYARNTINDDLALKYLRPPIYRESYEKMLSYPRKENLYRDGYGIGDEISQVLVNKMIKGIDRGYDKRDPRLINWKIINHGKQTILVL